MFDELTEITKIEKALTVAEGINFATIPTSTSIIENSLKEQLKTLIGSCQQDIQTCASVIEATNNGYLVPDELAADELIEDTSSLPEWFPTVFQTEYFKQKKNFDTQAKRLLLLRDLTNVQSSAARSLQSFRSLFDRYCALADNFGMRIDLLKDAQELDNLTIMMVEKHKNFLQEITRKVITFVRQISEKALGFSHQMSGIGMKSQSSKQMHAQSAIEPYTRSLQIGYSPVSHANRTAQGFFPQDNASRLSVGASYSRVMAPPYLPSGAHSSSFINPNMLPASPSSRLQVPSQPSRIGYHPRPQPNYSRLTLTNQQPFNNTNSSFYDKAASVLSTRMGYGAYR